MKTPEEILSDTIALISELTMLTRSTFVSTQSRLQFLKIYEKAEALKAELILHVPAPEPPATIVPIKDLEVPPKILEEKPPILPTVIKPVAPVIEPVVKEAVEPKPASKPSASKKKLDTHNKKSR